MAYEAKTKPNAASVAAFIASVENDRRREDAQVALDLYRRATGLEPKMWGDAIIGFGEADFIYQKTGNRSRIPAACFSPRRANMAFYLNGRFDGAEALYAKLGKYKKGVSCVTVNKLADIDLDILAEIVAKGTADNIARSK